MRCLICRSDEISLVLGRDTSTLTEAWRRRFDVEVGYLWGETARIELMSCRRCRGAFFLPPIVGDATFYEELAKLSWYYLRDRWEFHRAAREIRPQQTVLEVGCGEGNFLELARKKGAICEGTEGNPAAARLAIGKGFRIHVGQGVADLAANGRSFDVICAFQVLEHLPEPREFLEQARDLLKPRGRLILSVPNAASFIRLATDNLLDGPPHHVTRWTERTFRTVLPSIGLEFVESRRAPLESYHVEWYVDLWLSRLGCHAMSSRRIRRMLKNACVKVVQQLRSQITGHTLHVCAGRM